MHTKLIDRSKMRGEYGVLICGLAEHRPQPVTTLRHVDCGGGRRAVFYDAYSPTGAPVVARLAAQSRIILAEAGNGLGCRFSAQLAQEAVALAAEDPTASTA
ncbi:hypothetical protein NKJ70_32230 [Mesorhizobium sp. M0092]|uniref:hypothetical protein n=1 Tax=Mesorhizobium sp. M0092 TaxID=2956876 RepID=UPI003334BC64